MGKTAEKITLAGYEELLGTKKSQKGPEIIDLDIRAIKDFKNHPYKVLDDQKMDELVESVKKNGIVVPVIVRRTKNGYEMISGHRRKRACEKAGIERIPAHVVSLDDDEAVIYMVDTNLQREELLPSEKAWSYRMKLEAMSHQGKADGGQDGANPGDKTTSCQVGRKSEEETTSGQVDQKPDGKSASCQVGRRLNESGELIAQTAPDSGRQIHRYIRLTYLMPELLEYVDRKKIGFVPGVNLSYLNREEQGWVYEYIVTTEIFPNLQQTEKLKLFSGKSELTEAMVLEIIEDTGKPKEQKNFSIPYKVLRKYFPPTFEKDEINAVIMMLLDDWKNAPQEDE